MKAITAAGIIAAAIMASAGTTYALTSSRGAPSVRVTATPTTRVTVEPTTTSTTVVSPETTPPTIPSSATAVTTLPPAVPLTTPGAAMYQPPTVVVPTYPVVTATTLACPTGHVALDIGATQGGRMADSNFWEITTPATITNDTTAAISDVTGIQRYETSADNSGYGGGPTDMDWEPSGSESFDLQPGESEPARGSLDVESGAEPTPAAAPQFNLMWEAFPFSGECPAPQVVVSY